MADIERLIEQSSLGTPGAKAVRARTPREVVDRIVQRLDERRADPPESVTDDEAEVVYESGDTAAPSE